MKRKLFTFTCAALILTIFAAGCAKPPTEEMGKAREAVTRAENNNDAVSYAGNSLSRAREALSRMEAEAAAKRYDAAKSFAAEAVAAAERAISEGSAGAARARDEASGLIMEARSMAAETEQGINAARTAALPLDYEAVDRDFNTARGNVDQAQSALTGSRYQEASDKARQARAGLSAINQQLSTAALATSRKK